MTDAGGEITVERLHLKPEWVQKTGLERRDIMGPPLLFLFVGVALMIILLFSGGYLQRFVTMLLLSWIGSHIIFTASKDVNIISTWRRPQGEDKVQNLPLERMSGRMDRALKGLELSQTLIEKRLKRDLVEKIKEKKDMSEGDIKELLKNEDDLRKIVEDETLVDFLLNSKKIEDIVGKEDERVNGFHLLSRSEDVNKKKDSAYEKKMKDVMEKVSGWRGDEV